jgi:hypothetical protein
MLQQGFAGGGGVLDDLQLRVYLLPRLRGAQVQGQLPHCGNLSPRPIRPAAKLTVHLLSPVCVFNPAGCGGAGRELTKRSICDSPAPARMPSAIKLAHEPAEVSRGGERLNSSSSNWLGEPQPGDERLSGALRALASLINPPRRECRASGGEHIAGASSHSVFMYSSISID